MKKHTNMSDTKTKIFPQKKAERCEYVLKKFHAANEEYEDVSKTHYQLKISRCCCCCCEGEEKCYFITPKKTTSIYIEYLNIFI
jgi:hypothetical protein